MKNIRITAVLLVLAINSCAVVQSRITGQEIKPEPLVPVGSPEAVPVNIAKSDVIRAQQGSPGTVYGLYDVGRVEAVVSKVVESGK